ncbi:MAG: BlaI/MecI/CopY family transcriptional regulator [Lachnospiraceae bacterium]
MECERDMKGLTKRQEDVMNILWDAKEPIIASEIVKTGTDLNINTVQAALRSLIKKNYIEVAEIVYSGTVLTRSYRAIVKREEVPNETANEIRKALREEDVFARYIDEFDDSVLLAKLETIIEAKRKELEKAK